MSNRFCAGCAHKVAKRGDHGTPLCQICTEVVKVWENGNVSVYVHTPGEKEDKFVKLIPNPRPSPTPQPG